MNRELILFKTQEGQEVTFEDLLRKIYENSEEKQKNLLATVEFMKPLIHTLQDAVIIAPTLVALNECSVRNDDALIKMAAIVSRMQSKIKKSEFNEDMIMSPEERKQLIAQARESSVPGSSMND